VPDPTVIMCSRRTEPAVPGSVVRVCAKCEQDVWVSLSGQKLLERKSDVKIECMPCAWPSLRSGAVPVQAVDGAYDELRQHAGFTAELMARLFTGALQEKYIRRSN
jgi:hypothetical protein